MKTPALVLQLINTLRPGSNLDDIEYYIKLLNRYDIQALNKSNIGASKTLPDEHSLIDGLKKKLLVQDETAKLALELSRALTRLKPKVCLFLIKIQKLSAYPAILYFLTCLTNANSRINAQIVTTVTGAMPKKYETVNAGSKKEECVENDRKSLWRPMKPMEPFSPDMVPQFQGYYQVGKSKVL